MLSLARLKEDLKQAANAVDETGLADDLRPIAFERLLDVLALTSTPSSLDAGPTEHVSDRARGPTRAADGILDKVAKRLGLLPDAASHIYEEHEGELRLIIRR